VRPRLAKAQFRLMAPVSTYDIRQILGPGGPVRSYAVLRNGWRAIYDRHHGNTMIPRGYRELRVLAGRLNVTVRVDGRSTRR
jgi:hypothetical protein